MKISRHANKRMKERCGLNYSSHDRVAEFVLLKGLCHKDCTGRLKKYVDYLFFSYPSGNNIRLYGDHVYIFNSTNLITILKLPNIYKNAVNKLTKRKRSL